MFVNIGQHLLDANAVFILHKIGIADAILQIFQQREQHPHQRDLHEYLVAVAVADERLKRLDKPVDRRFLPRHVAAEQHIRHRGAAHKRRDVSLLDDALRKAGDKLRHEEQAVNPAGDALLPALELVQHVAVDEDRVSGMQQILGFATEHERVPLRGENDLQLLVPVPGNVAHEVFAGVFIIARAGKDGGSVFGELVQVGRDRNIEQLQCFHNVTHFFNAGE